MQDVHPFGHRTIVDVVLLTWHSHGLFHPGTAESDGDKEVDRLCRSTLFELMDSWSAAAAPAAIFRPIKGVWDMSNVKSIVLPEEQRDEDHESQLNAIEIRNIQYYCQTWQFLFHEHVDIGKRVMRSGGLRVPVNVMSGRRWSDQRG